MNDERDGDGSRRGLFRRGRRSSDETHAPRATETAVATVDELARRMDELVAEGRGLADDPVRAEFEMQRALIARANDIAATTTPADATTSTEPTHTTPRPGAAPEATVQQQPTSQDSQPTTTTHEDDIEARLDAALQPVPVPTADAGTVTLEPTTTPAASAASAPAPQPVDTSDAVLSPVTPTVHEDALDSTDAAARIGIDVDRIVRMIEDEAVGVQRRIELELSHAHARAEEIVDRAEHEAERIREHGQAQARVLLGEVEEIISEAQQTGEQILLRANEEAAGMRSESTAVLQQAQSEARSIVETARREGEQVLAEQRRLATVRAQEAMREQERLKDQIRRLEERRRQVLESLEPLISQLTQMMPATGAASSHAAPQNVVHLQRQPQQQPAQQR